ncbi:hypothetical protein QE152_g40032 [Popillia japonica]|uniref:Uncharacterized protein n=1 Tax=Popillia japonica TaxID=7064 RepID=A0AAW1HT46_POPJA
MTSKEAIPQPSIKGQKKSVKHVPKSEETSKNCKKHKYRSRRLTYEADDGSSSSESLQTQKDKHSSKHHSSSKESDLKLRSHPNNNVVQNSEHKYDTRKERRSSSDQSKSKEKRRPQREHVLFDSSSSSSNSSTICRKCLRYKKRSSNSPKKRDPKRKLRSLSETKKDLPNDPSNDIKFALLGRRCGCISIQQDSKPTITEATLESAEPADFDKNTLDASTILVLPVRFQDDNMPSKPILTPLDSSELIQHSLPGEEEEAEEEKEEEKKGESKLVVTQNIDDPKYFLVQPGTSRDYKGNISYPRSAPTTRREIQSTERNFGHESDMMGSSELDLTASALLLAPYTSPNCSKAFKIGNCSTDNSSVAYRLVHPKNINQELAKRSDQSDFDIGSLDDFQSCQNVLDNNLYDNIREFFADLPLPAAPSSSNSTRPYYSESQEDIRQRWKREFGQQSEDDDDDESDGEEEAEDLEIILDLCNDRFLKRRPQSRE